MEDRGGKVEILEKEITNVSLKTRFLLSLRQGLLNRLLPVWLASLGLSIFVVYMLDSMVGRSGGEQVIMTSGRFVGTAALSLICEYVDSTLGMGYGTTLTPLLLLIGYDPVQVVPALLVSQWLAGIAAGISHTRAGNIDLSMGSLHLKVALTLSACGIVGALVAVRVFISFTQPVLTLLIGFVVVIVGVVILATRNHPIKFSWWKIIFVGVIASFNKGFSAGGYGPIVTGGQVLSGLVSRAAISITVLSEGITCLVAVMAFLASGEVKDLSVAFPLVVGAVCGVPFSAYTVRRVPMKNLTVMIGYVTIILGLVTLYKSWISFTA